MALGNSFGRTTSTYGSGKKVWNRVLGIYPIGGTIDVSGYSEGTVIPAGTMCILNQATHVITLVTAADAENITSVNGLLAEDVVVDDLAKGTNGAATGSVVYAGEVYVDRLAVDISGATGLTHIIKIKETA